MSFDRAARTTDFIRIPETDCDLKPVELSCS
jgi:hypothetical protein